MSKKVINGIFIVILFLVSICFGHGSLEVTGDLLPIETWITDINWNLHEDLLLTTDSSEFDINSDFNIYNPNDVNVTLTFPHSKQFVGNFSAELEDENHNASCYTGGAFTAITYRTLEPGLSQDSTSIFRMQFDSDGLIVLPNGNYSFWIYGEGNPDIISHLTNLTVIDGEIFIDYFITTIPTPPTTSPTLEININYLEIGISIIVFGCLLYIIKKKNG